MKQYLLGGVAAAIAFACMPSPASAVVVHHTYVGVIGYAVEECDDGSRACSADESFFGTDGKEALIGLAYTLKFTFDAALPGMFTGPMTAALTIAGKTLTWSGSGSASAKLNPGPVYFNEGYSRYSTALLVPQSFSVYADVRYFWPFGTQSPVPGDLLTSFGPTAYNSYDSEIWIDLNSAEHTLYGFSMANGTLEVTTDPPAPVPLPGALVLMMTAIGLLTFVRRNA